MAYPRLLRRSIYPHPHRRKGSEGLEAPDDLLVVAEEGEKFIAVLDFVRQVVDWLQTDREKIEILLLESIVPENLYFG
jgi:hypothetical protein